MYAIIKEEGVPDMAFQFGEERTFKTGRKGYFASGKAEFRGKRYQVTLLLVEIKPK